MKRLTTAYMFAAIVVATIHPVAKAADGESARLVDTLRSSTASDHDIAVACEQLATAGDAAAIEPLAALLDNPRFSHYARTALQANPDPAAGAALRKSLGAVTGQRLVGVINSLAARRDRDAIPLLEPLLQSDDRQVAVAAAGALAAIGGDDVGARLSRSGHAHNADFADAFLAAAIGEARAGRPEGLVLLGEIRKGEYPQCVKVGATLALVRYSPADDADQLTHALLTSREDWGFEAGLQAAVQSPRPGGGKLLAAALVASDSARQGRLLAAIKDQGDASALDAVRAAAASTDGRLRLAATAALGALGDASDAALLVKLALEDQQGGGAARDALASIEDSALDAAMLEMLRRPDPAEQALAADVCGRRRLQTAAPALLQLAQASPDPQVRAAALEATRRIAPGELLGPLVDLIANLKAPAEQQLARQAAAAAALRVADRDAAAAAVAERLANWPASSRGVLFDLLKSIGGAKSLKLVADAARSPERTNQDEATRVLGAWPTSDAAPILLDLAGADHPFAIRALRGYLRIARQLNVAEDERLTMCRRALALANRNEERMLAMTILERIPGKGSLDLAVSQLDGDKLGPAAGPVVVRISEAILIHDRASAQSAARRVLEIGGDETVLVRARAIAGE